MRRQQEEFNERQEALFRQQREALEALVRKVTAERPRTYFGKFLRFPGIQMSSWLGWRRLTVSVKHDRGNSGMFR